MVPRNSQLTRTFRPKKIKKRKNNTIRTKREKIKTSDNPNHGKEQRPFLLPPNTCIYGQEEKRQKLQHLREDKGKRMNGGKQGKNRQNKKEIKKNNDNRGCEQGRPYQTESYRQQAAAPVLSDGKRRHHVRKISSCLCGISSHFVIIHIILR